MGVKKSSSDIRLCDIPRFAYWVGKGSYKSSDASVSRYASKVMASCGNDPVKACDKVSYMVCLTPSLDKRQFLNAVSGYFRDKYEREFSIQALDDSVWLESQYEKELADKDREIEKLRSALRR